jgi:hypothetical protein
MDSSGLCGRIGKKVCPPVEQCHYALQKEQKDIFPMNGRISDGGVFFPLNVALLIY